MSGPTIGIDVSEQGSYHSYLNPDVKLGARRFKRWEHGTAIVKWLKNAMYECAEELVDVEDLPEMKVGRIDYGPDPFQRLAEDPALVEKFLAREESYPSRRQKFHDPRRAWEARIHSEFRKYRGWIPVDFLVSLEDLVLRRWNKYGPLEFKWEQDFFVLPDCTHGFKELLLFGLDSRYRSVVHAWCLVMGLHSETNKETFVLRITPPRSDESLVDLPERLSVLEVLMERKKAPRSVDRKEENSSKC